MTLATAFWENHAHFYQGVLYDLGAGESPYKDFFLQHAVQYVAVDWTGGFHETKADIAADLDQPLPIDLSVADAVVSLSVLEHLGETQIMLNEAFRILKPGGGWCCRFPSNGGSMKRPMTFFATRRMGSHIFWRKPGLSTLPSKRKPGSSACSS